MTEFSNSQNVAVPGRTRTNRRMKRSHLLLAPEETCLKIGPGSQAEQKGLKTQKKSFLDKQTDRPASLSEFWGRHWDQTASRRPSLRSTARVRSAACFLRGNGHPGAGGQIGPIPPRSFRERRQRLNGQPQIHIPIYL